MSTTIKHRMIMGVSLLMMTFSFASNGVGEESCTEVPTCEELGYTETSCGTAMPLKCPFDHSKLFCLEKCPVGYIYYCDNTCSEDYDNSKTVVGVVAGNGFVVNIENALYSGNYKMSWNNAVTRCMGTHKCTQAYEARLPKSYEAEEIQNNLSDINAGLAKISGATQFADQFYWTSRSSSAGSAYRFVPTSNTMYGDGDKTEGNYYVRCVFAF